MLTPGKHAYVLEKTIHECEKKSSWGLNKLFTGPDKFFCRLERNYPYTHFVAKH
jgi:hypothetical protein